MAYAFNGTSSHVAIYTTGNTIPITAFPFTLAATAFSNSATSTQGIIGLGKVGAGAEYSLSLVFDGASAGAPISMRRIYNGSGFTTPDSASYSTGQWYSIAGVFNAADDVSLYVDGTKYTSTDSVAFPVGAYQWIELGSNINISNFQWLNGKGQAFAAWDAALTDEEVISLSRGFAPRRIRPQSLVMYYPGVRNNDDERTGIQVQNAASNSPTEHYRVYGV